MNERIRRNKEGSARGEEEKEKGERREENYRGRNLLKGYVVTVVRYNWVYRRAR